MERWGQGAPAPRSACSSTCVQEHGLFPGRMTASHATSAVVFNLLLPGAHKLQNLICEVGGGIPEFAVLAGASYQGHPLSNLLEPAHSPPLFVPSLSSIVLHFSFGGNISLLI